MLSSTKEKISDSLKEFYRNNPLAISGIGVVAGASVTALAKEYKHQNTLIGRLQKRLT